MAALRRSGPARRDGAAAPALSSEIVLPATSGNGLVTAVVAAILIVGFGASLLLWDRADSDARRAETELADRAAKVLDSTARLLVGSFAGSDGIVDDDGNTSTSRFEAFARGVIAAGPATSIAFEKVVLAGQRDDFERSAGARILAASPAGLQPSPERDVYLPVVHVYPLNAQTRLVLGFDIGSEPTRNDAAMRARDAGAPVITRAVLTQPAGDLAFFVVHPVYRPGRPRDTVEQRRAALAGFTSTAFRAELLYDAVMNQMPAGTRISISDGEMIVAATPRAPRRGTQAEISRNGVSWVLTAEGAGADHRTSVLAAVGTTLIASAVAWVLLRSRRQTRELRDAAVSVRRLGLLSEQLAIARSREEVASVVGELSPPILGAQMGTLAVTSDDGTALVASDASRRDAALGDVDPAVLLVNAWRSATPVYASGAAAIRRTFPGAADALLAAGYQAVATKPLRNHNGVLLGAVGWAWRDRRRFPDRFRSTVQATAKLCEQSMERAVDQEERIRSATSLSELGQRLTAARTAERVAHDIIELAPSVAGASRVAVGFLDHTGARMRLSRTSAEGTDQLTTEITVDPSGLLLTLLGNGREIQFSDPGDLADHPVLSAVVAPEVKKVVCVPLIEAGGRLLGLVAFAFADAAVEPEPGRLATVANLAVSTIERAHLYQMEHALVVQLQQRTLPDLTSLGTELEVAARYLPAATTIGIGGDWYDVEVFPDGRVAVVVGDVVGHGIDAIADMTEFRTTISTLLRTHDDIAGMLEVSSQLLRSVTDDLRFATVAVMVIDRDRRRLTYVRAGHPPPVVRLPSGEVLLLEGAGTTPIGVTGRPAVAEEVDLPDGSVLVAYTDGLIERHGEGLEAGLERLRTVVGGLDPRLPADTLATMLVERCLDGRETEDDTALLVIAFGSAAAEAP